MLRVIVTPQDKVFSQPHLVHCPPSLNFVFFLFITFNYALFTLYTLRDIPLCQISQLLLVVSFLKALILQHFSIQIGLYFFQI